MQSLKKIKCPVCEKEISVENINVQTDLAKCGNCGNLFKLSEAIDVEPDDGFDLNKPPNGAWIKQDRHSIVIGATTRSPIAFFLVPFMLVWSGGSLGGIYGTQIISGEFNLLMSLFGIPFLLGSVIFWSFALMAIAGKAELTLDNHGGKTFVGLGTIGLTKAFTWDEISEVKENTTNFHYPGSQNGVIQLVGKRKISFGMGVKEERRYYLFRAIKKILRMVKSKRSLL